MIFSTQINTTTYLFWCTNYCSSHYHYHNKPPNAIPLFIVILMYWYQQIPQYLLRKTTSNKALHMMKNVKYLTCDNPLWHSLLTLINIGIRHLMSHWMHQVKVLISPPFYPMGVYPWYSSENPHMLSLWGFQNECSNHSCVKPIKEESLYYHTVENAICFYIWYLTPHNPPKLLPEISHLFQIFT